MPNVPVPGWDGIVSVPEEGLTKQELSLLGTIHNHIGAFLSGADREGKAIRGHEGTVVGGIAIVTDLDRIEDLDAEDRLSFEAFYDPP
ncbi:MAG: hypothetical protein WEA10_04885 [Actinomycetota bacterium]